MQIGPSEITVTMPTGAATIIRRDPFRISIRDPRGQVVLAEAANTARTPTVEPPTAFPPPLGSTPARDPGQAVHSPLSCLVRTKTLRQYTAALYVGDVQSGAENGTIFSAQRDMAASSDRGSVRLTLSTDDLTGRVISVRIGPDHRGAIDVAATPQP